MRMNRSDRPHKNGAKRRNETPDDDDFIVLTGQRQHDHFRLDVAGQPVWLTCDAFTAFVGLVCAAIATGSGNVVIERVTICRLRKALGSAGKRLIETGSGHEYHLAIAKTEIAARVHVTPCFFELVDRHVISKEQADLLRKNLRPCRVREAEVKPRRNRKATKRKPRRNRKATKRKPKRN